MATKKEIDQEGLPHYWGIETWARHASPLHPHQHQEGLHDYWGIGIDHLGVVLEL